MANRTGENSADMWSNTKKDGTGNDYQPLVDDDGILKSKLTNAAGTKINPATEEKQDDGISELQTIGTTQTDGSQKTQVVAPKMIDTDNSTVITLGIDGLWEGEWVATDDYVQAIIDVVTDQDSASFGLKIELSNDGINVVHTHSFSILANTPDGHHYPSELELNYYRITYTNGGIAQTTFKLYSTLFKTMVEEGHQHGLDFAIDDDHSAPIVRNVNVAKKPDGSYVNIEATTAGNLKVALEEYDDTTNPFLRVNDSMLTIAHGSNPLISNVSYVNKFGGNPNIDTATAPEDVWDVGGLWVPPTLPRIHDLASSDINDIGSVLSSGTATGGSTTTLEDTGATFVSDGVAVGDTVLNDTNGDHGTVTAVTETIITGTWAHINDPRRTSVGFNTGDSYRVVNATSTGASIIHVIGLDANMVKQDEFIVTNGTTNVPTVNTYYRIHRMSVLGAAGRTVTNVGNISATAQTDGTITAQINIGNGQSGMAIYTIPKGKIGYMTQVYADIVKDGGVTTSASFTLRETPIADIDGAGSRSKHFFGLVETGTTHYPHNFKPYRRILENTDVWIRVDSVGSNGTVISAGFDIILVNIN